MTASVGHPQRAQSRALACAWCGLWLVMPLPVGVVLAFGQNLILLSAHNNTFVSVMTTLLPALVLLGLFFVGGALWGQGLARLFDLPLRQARLAGAAGYALPLIGVAMVLAQVEGNLIEFVFDGWKMHILYGLLFVPATFLIAATAGGAVGATTGNPRLALKLAINSGLGAALGFLLVEIMMDLLGMRVGAPGAEERFTMLVVTMLGMMGAALAGSWMWGFTLQAAHRSGPKSVV